MKQKHVIQSSFWSNLFNQTTKKDTFAEIIKSIPFFNNLSGNSLNNFLSLIHYRNYAKNEVIFLKDDPGIALYIIIEGKVQIELIDSDMQIILANFTRGDFFGELALLNDSKRSANAVAKTDCSLAIVFKPDLDEYIYKYPKSGSFILQGLCNVIASRLRNLNLEYLNLYLKYHKKEV